MKKKEFIAELKSLGWTQQRTDGETFYRYAKDDRLIDVNPTIRPMVGRTMVAPGVSVTTEAFIAATDAVSGKNEGGYPLVVPWPPQDGVYVTQLDAEVVAEISQQSIDWGMAQDLDAALASMCAYATDEPGSRPLLHLAALALAGETEKLESYRQSFEAGDRLGFVPYIDIGYIERALALAKERDG
ncbi:hypothetical protein MLD63_07415 [Paracoccus sp. TK19116]|uniref:Uncharacterized protein n=1 Tax=Paracoccus albicereus TaxID=2922394 RepID=A0ABT1MSB6_9RHOB|nr:hypothetical protein [Paracoccus albicereus]MCQ0970248.1 hypothetical protein [Paracoccus albicereus]